jgi:hypothetical protein
MFVDFTIGSKTVLIRTISIVFRVVHDQIIPEIGRFDAILQ